jgi:predicted Rossmann fold flavoprotein
MVNARYADVVIAGAGAAGLMCAIESAKRGRRTIVLERNAKIGEKIRISGGGRCNFTNIHTTAENFISDNPNFPKSALSRYTPANFITMVERHKIRYHEKKAGQLFCDGSSSEIITMLHKENLATGTTILPACSIQRVTRGASGFRISTNLGLLECASFVVATGGLSIPKIGATDFGYRIAKQFGLRMVLPRPGLVPLTLEGPEWKSLRDLHGVSAEAVVSHAKVSFQDNILVTHRGLSGPAILQISSYWLESDPIIINLIGPIPRRLLNIVRSPLEPWALTPSGTEGYGKAEVTVGGVDTRELSSKTMECLKVPGLYFIGEVVDVTGHLGGFNFQWAWASGVAAGQSA